MKKYEKLNKEEEMLKLRISELPTNGHKKIILLERLKNVVLEKLRIENEIRRR